MCIRDRATTGATLPLPVLHARCASRSIAAGSFLPLGEEPASILGPRSALTDPSGSTGSSHSQQRQWSRSPTSLSVLMSEGYGDAQRCRPPAGVFSSESASRPRLDLLELPLWGTPAGLVSISLLRPPPLAEGADQRYTLSESWQCDRPDCKGPAVLRSPKSLRPVRPQHASDESVEPYRAFGGRE